MSRGEEKICGILQSEKVYFQREKIFSTLRGGKLRYDFYIPSLNILIEYDGEQHFKYIKKFYKNENEFKSAKERDRIKNSYALAHGIKLYRIPFWALNSINSLKSIQNDSFLVQNKYHNDRIWQNYTNYIKDST